MIEDTVTLSKKIVCNNYRFSEKTFNELLPLYLQKASDLYFTPIPVAETAAHWLTEAGEKKILDIGAGVGKFCMAGARVSSSFFYGMEYRSSLATLANQLIDSFEIVNAKVFHGNILDVDFSDYNAFYLYNPFSENFLTDKKLNDEVQLSDKLYSKYVTHTHTQLSMAEKGTRIVTYHGNNFELPEKYVQQQQAFQGKLKLWQKT